MDESLLVRIKRIEPEQLISFGLLSFIFLSLLQPWDGVSKAFVFLGIIPGAVWAGIKYRHDFSEHKSLWLIFAVLIVYMILSAIGFSEAETKQIKRHVKWAVEVVLFSLAVFFVIPLWLKQATRFSNIILLGVLIVSLWAILGFLFIGVDTVANYAPELVKLRYGDRLSWFGFLAHPIKGPSVVVMMFAVGLLLYKERSQHCWQSFIVLCTSFSSVLVLCLMSESRGPLGSLLIFTMAFIVISWVSKEEGRVKPSLIFVALLLGVIALLVFNEFRSLTDVVQNLFSRGSSRRFDVWGAVLGESLIQPWFGYGIATEFNDTGAGLALHELFGRPMSHSHNIFLHAFTMSGGIGLGLFVMFFLGLCFTVVRSSIDILFKLRVLAMLGLFLLLTATEGYRLVSSPRPDWIMVWLPLFLTLGYLTVKKREVKQGGE